MLFAKLANADDWEEIEIFAKSNEEFLKQYIALENGIPSHDTIQRVMGNIAPEYMQGVYKEWNELVNSKEGEILKKIICIEITAIPKLLDTIQVKGNIITIDAMGTQTEIAEKIKQKRADYTLAVKENQKNLYKEIREYYQCDQIKWMEEKGRWKGIKSIGMIYKTTKREEEQIVEKKYYISSLPLNVELFARTVREH